MDTGIDLVAPGRVAVVTGAASGIGFGLAERFAAEGMRVVMADVEEPALAEAAQLLGGRGAEVLPVPTDVSRADHVDALRDRTLSTFGAVHVVCNNAGVGGAPNPVWELPAGERGRVATQHSLEKIGEVPLADDDVSEMVLRAPRLASRMLAGRAGPRGRWTPPGVAGTGRRRAAGEPGARCRGACQDAPRSASRCAGAAVGGRVNLEGG